ncbi:unnamed protein product [Symbiodinium sp. CCMP2592]|nr:unnamed protein product [Symbiodinium sp. CCMP2592]
MDAPLKEQVRKALRDRTEVDAAEPPLKKMNGKTGPPKAVCGKARGKGGKGKEGKAAECELPASSAGEPMVSAQVAVGTNDTKPVENAQVAEGTSDPKPVENAQAAVGTHDTKPVENAQVGLSASSAEPDGHVAPAHGAVTSAGGDADPNRATGVDGRHQHIWVQTVSQV